MRFTADDGDVGERVDAVVARRTGVARTSAQRALKEGDVTVSGRAVRPSHRLEAGDVVEGDVRATAPAAPGAEDIPLDVVHSDHRVVVVAKPAGLVTHPAGAHASGTLVNALLALGVSPDAGDPARPGIVHRLDKDTSGALLAAKDADAHAYLVAAMKARRIARTYLALVRGRMPAGSGTVEAPVGRHPVRRTRMAVVGSGRPAVTHYEVVDGNADASLVVVRLETGRTHQIRVHLSHIRHPVVGDRTYGGYSELARSLGLARPFLHAWRLAFPHPDDGRTIEALAPLPDDLERALQSLDLNAPRF